MVHISMLSDSLNKFIPCGQQTRIRHSLFIIVGLTDGTR